MKSWVESNHVGELPNSTSTVNWDPCNPFSNVHHGQFIVTLVNLDNLQYQYYFNF